MTIQERHDEVNKIIAKLKVLHEKYFPPARPLTDEEWEKYIDGIWAVAEEYKGTNLENFAAELTMVFSDDIEKVHKAWEKRRGNEVQKAKQE
ncbi:hypothetical protein [Butyrivibrio sp. AE2032]|uniref:hypothetical protein n=1 Tax=Butyrivibrio sp. AE2032 TaxID=1458463 RepID=UPI00054D9DA3|nr:hypothetical protein [Butyrivibrio sp. AE2032]